MKLNRSRFILAAAVAFTLAATVAKAQYTETLNVADPGLYTGSPLIADAAGNFYGATGGGIGPCYPYGCGQIFELPSGSQSANIIYQFTGYTDGSGPTDRLTADAKGNIYGVTNSGGNMDACGGSGCGVVFELSPTTGSAWTESVLYAFSDTGDGGAPYGGVVFDAKGNLYGVLEMEEAIRARAQTTADSNSSFHPTPAVGGLRPSFTHLSAPSTEEGLPVC